MSSLLLQLLFLFAAAVLVLVITTAAVAAAFVEGVFVEFAASVVVAFVEVAVVDWLLLLLPQLWPVQGRQWPVVVVVAVVADAVVCSQWLQGL